MKNTMEVHISFGKTGDTISIVVYSPAGDSLFKEEFNYGRNCSTSRLYAAKAEDAHNTAIKYKFANIPPLKPYIGDIVESIRKDFNISEDEILWTGYYEMRNKAATMEEMISAIGRIMAEV